MDITAIIPIAPGVQVPFVPPSTDYDATSVPWIEAEYPCHDAPASRVRVGYWTGEPGHVSIDPWPYTEICSIVRGRVALVDCHGGRREFGVGDGFIVPKGFAGTWLTLESAAKVFVAVG